MRERVQKILARRGVASRRKCEELIMEARVKVNNRIIKIGDSADAGKDLITVDGKTVKEKKKVYIALNKPKRYITAVSDKYDRRIITDLLPEGEKIFPVGRLDRDVEGLLLLTNDGELANRIMHPRYETEKIYEATLDRRIKKADMLKVKEGKIVLKDGRVHPAKIREIRTNTVEIKLHEGRNKIVKRIFNELGYRVKYLRRTGIANIGMKGLKLGRYRHLTKKEIEGLRNNPLKKAARPANI